MKLFFFLGTFILLSFFNAEVASAQTDIALCPESTTDFNFNILCQLNPGTAFPSLLSFILIAAIVIALLYLIWGGIKWITSGGDKGNVETARSHIVAAVIGLIIVFLAWFIINFILQTFFGSGLGGGISLPTINDDTTAPATPTPPAETPEVTPEVTPPDENPVTTTVPPCPTAYPPDFICQLQE